MEQKNSFLDSLKIAIPIACVVIGSMVGHNSATAQIMVQYVGSSGTWIMFLPIISMFILGLAVAVCCELARRYQAYDYGRQFAAQTGPLGKQKWFLVINDIFQVFSMIIGFASIWATTAMVVEGFGVPSAVGYVGVIVITMILAKYGSGFLAKMNTVLVFLIIGVMLVFCVVAIASPTGTMSISESVSTMYNPNPDIPVFTVIWGAIMWGAYQTGQGAHASPTMTKIKTPRDSIMTGLAVWILSSIFYCINGLAIVSAAPDIYGQTAPNLLILADLSAKFPWLYWLFNIMILMSILSTTVALTNSMVARWSRVLPANWKPLAKYAAVVLVIYGGSLILSRIGLAKIVGLTVYSGYWNMAFVMIPLLVVWPILFIIRGKKTSSSEDVKKDTTNV